MVFVVFLLHPLSYIDNIAQSNGLITTDQGNRPQLVHGPIELPPGFFPPGGDRELEKESPWIQTQFTQHFAEDRRRISGAVAKAYRFLSRNYRPGDHIVLAVDPVHGESTDLHLGAVEMLVRHLYDGTCPDGLPKVQSVDKGDALEKRMPIRCVLVGAFSSVGSISARSKELTFKLAPRVEQIICWDFVYGSSQCCSTRFDSEGVVISREICFTKQAFNYELRRRATEHIIYHDDYNLPVMDEQALVWTHAFSSLCSETGEALSLDLRRPCGTYHHELRKYQNQWRSGDNMLVWKLSRSEDENGS
ncbi:unnamed protein product [Rhizoctonia solani]|uniref:Uncharacterized protein n=1 Tax=Rhizoctonia solani TaxID=456999 RepID=A0A8H3GZD6_9AGAM|nr:unnamed protein product [Rhizoctonia solani]